jgi:RNA polymerase sigma factor (sigma-70 family)
MHFRHRRVEQSYLGREARRPAPEPYQPDVATREAIRRALYRLPERQRAAIVLRYYEDLTEVQTAEALQCPVGTVKSLVSRGMETLRREMRDA